VHVFIATSPYRRNDRQHAPSATLPLTAPSADTRVLISAAVRALRSVFRPGFNYVKAGVMLVDLQPQAQEHATPDLFADEPEPEAARRDRSELMSALDALNQRFGRHAVSVASAARRAGPSAHASRQDRRSPRYTTRIDEVVTARA
jgi:DNA polymerase V